MNEDHLSEVEKTLLFISDARERAQKGADALQRKGADQHLVDALRAAESDLADLHRTLMQQTYFAVPREAVEAAPEEQLSL
jgi:hypothetical protein